MINDNSKSEQDNINEPSVSYHITGDNKVRFLSSYKEQEDEMINYWASITPIQRMAHLHEMIIASYGLTKEQIANPKLSNKITFITNEK